MNGGQTSAGPLKIFGKSTSSFAPTVKNMAAQATKIYMLKTAAKKILVDRSFMFMTLALTPCWPRKWLLGTDGFNNKTKSCKFLTLPIRVNLHRRCFRFYEHASLES